MVKRGGRIDGQYLKTIHADRIPMWNVPGTGGDEAIPKKFRWLCEKCGTEYIARRDAAMCEAKHTGKCSDCQYRMRGVSPCPIMDIERCPHYEPERIAQPCPAVDSGVV